MRICLVYDCVYPLTIGGAERWYRALAEALAADGHQVTYLTRRQWAKGGDAGVPGVDVVAVSPATELYDGELLSSFSYHQTGDRATYRSPTGIVTQYMYDSLHRHQHNGPRR